MIFSGRKLLFAIADYAAILNKAIITYPLENFRYLTKQGKRNYFWTYRRKRRPPPIVLFIA